MLSFEFESTTNMSLAIFFDARIVFLIVFSELNVRIITAIFFPHSFYNLFSYIFSAILKSSNQSISKDFVFLIFKKHILDPILFFLIL